MTNHHIDWGRKLWTGCVARGKIALPKRNEGNEMKANEVKAGMKVTMASFDGTIVKVCEWSRSIVDGVEGVMVEVRLPGGVACYSCSDLVAA